MLLCRSDGSFLLLTPLPSVFRCVESECDHESLCKELILLHNPMRKCLEYANLHLVVKRRKKLLARGGFHIIKFHPLSKKLSMRLHQTLK